MSLYRVDADWVSTPFPPSEEIGLFVFRLTFDLSQIPATLPIQVSADQRYRLYLNGVPLGIGPQADSLDHYRVDPYDLALHAKTGKNVFHAVVSNYGHRAALWQHTQRLAFLCEIKTPAADLSTGTGPWQVAKVKDFDFGDYQAGARWPIYRVSPGELLTTALLPYAAMGQAEELGFRPVFRIDDAHSGQDLWATSFWFVRPRSIHPVQSDPFPNPVSRVLKDGFRVPVSSYTAEPGERILLDAGEIVTGFPHFTLSSDQNAEIKAVYTEALLNPDNTKGDRNETVGKRAEGYADRLQTNAGRHNFEPFLWRTFRYIELTSDKPFTVHNFTITELGYLPPNQSKFTADISDIEKIHEVAYLTARRCARETYMDCPYYEELQYAGDTRIQALIGYYTSPDRTLQRNAVDQLTRAALGDGLVSSRTPCRELQSILPFHWFTLMMVSDLVLHDPEAEWGSGTRLTALWDRLWHGIEEWMIGWRKNDDHGSWMFGDWVGAWGVGAPPTGRFHPMHVLARQVAYDLRRFVEGQTSPLDLPELTPDLKTNPDGLYNQLQDRPQVPTNEHAEAMRRYRQWIFGLPVDPWPDESLFTDRTTLYYSYYRHLVQQNAPYSELLAPWRRMLSLGLSTFPEKEDNPRSECHAWSSHPILGSFQRVAGIRSLAPGWQKCLVAPHPADSLAFRAEIPHPSGPLIVERQGERLFVDSPVELVVAWNGRRQSRAPGQHTF